MSGSLVTRVEKLEAKTGGAGADVIRLTRLCITDEEVAAVLEEAARSGIPEDQVLIIRLAPLEPNAEAGA